MEITRYERVIKNKVIGFVDIKLPILKPTVLIMRHISHLRSGTREWFNLPSFPSGPQGENPTYYRYWEFENSEHNARFLEALGKETEAYCRENKVIDNTIAQAVNYERGAMEVPF